MFLPPSRSLTLDFLLPPPGLLSPSPLLYAVFTPLVFVKLHVGRFHPTYSESAPEPQSVHTPPTLVSESSDRCHVSPIEQTRRYSLPQGFTSFQTIVVKHNIHSVRVPRFGQVRK